MQLNLELQEKCNSSSASQALDFQVGDRVRHKLAGITGTIKRMNESVVTITRDTPDISYTWGIRQACYTAVCLIENIEHIK